MMTTVHTAIQFTRLLRSGQHAAPLGLDTDLDFAGYTHLAPPALAGLKQDRGGGIGTNSVGARCL